MGTDNADFNVWCTHLIDFRRIRNHSNFQFYRRLAIRKIDESLYRSWKDPWHASFFHYGCYMRSFLSFNGAFFMAGCPLFRNHFCTFMRNQHTSSHLYSFTSIFLWTCFYCRRNVQFQRIFRRWLFRYSLWFLGRFIWMEQQYYFVAFPLYHRCSFRFSRICLFTLS